MIIHCMTRKTWDERKDKPEWGRRNLEQDGFIHCSTARNFWRVVPNFKTVDQPLVLVCIDEDKLASQVRYEPDPESGRLYPHIYGPVNRDAVVQVLPFLRDAVGDYVKNPEFADIEQE